MYTTVYFILQRVRKAEQKAFSALVQKIGVISIGLGLSMTIIGILSLAGFQENIEQKLTNFQGQLQVYAYTSNRTPEELPISIDKIQGITPKLAAEFQSIQPYAHRSVLLQSGNLLEGVVLKGINPKLAEGKLIPYLTAGRFIHAEQTGYSHEIILSNALATRLKVRLGEEIMAYLLQNPPRYRKLKVVGFYTTYLEELDAALAFCDIGFVQRLNAWPDSLVGGYEVFLQNPRQTKTIANTLLDCLDYDLVVKTTEETYPAIFDWLVIMRKDVIIFLSLILIVAMSNLIAIVLIQAMERTKMIGILRALGANDRLIIITMFFNSLNLVFKGVLLGNILGLGLGALQSYAKVIRLDPTYYYIHYIPIVWNGWIILGLNIGVFLLASLVLFVSTMLIARLSPIKAIRFQ